MGSIGRRIYTPSSRAAPAAPVLVAIYAAVCHPARAAGVLDAAFGGLPHPKPPQQPSLACKTRQKICNSVTNATFSIFNRAIFYSGPTIFYNIFPERRQTEGPQFEVTGAQVLIFITAVLTVAYFAGLLPDP